MSGDYEEESVVLQIREKLHAYSLLYRQDERQ